jgi:5-dehydro-2-deoxygluconokinase
MALEKDFTKRQLLILAFDHRGSFMEKLFGIKGRPPTVAETSRICDFKKVVYEGFSKAIADGVPKPIAGILVDEQFGAAIAVDARANGVNFAMPVEKSGQDEFDFEYGGAFGHHLEDFAPAFAKVLVRYNHEADAVMNKRQLARLKTLGEYLERTNRGYLFELLVPATADQLAKLNGDKAAYDSQLRPKLMVRAMADIQAAGVEPDVWKMEGVDSPKDARAIVAQAQANGRKAGVITLGRGESKEKVKEWLSVGAKIPGIIGFAVGRTIFWDALAGLKDGKHSREEAVEMVARNYKEFVSLWQGEKR